MKEAEAEQRAALAQRQEAAAQEEAEMRQREEAERHRLEEARKEQLQTQRAALVIAQEERARVAEAALRAADAEARRLQVIAQREEAEREALRVQDKRAAENAQRELELAALAAQAALKAQEEQIIVQNVALATDQAESAVASEIWQEMPERARQKAIEAQLKLLGSASLRERGQRAETAATMSRFAAEMAEAEVVRAEHDEQNKARKLRIKQEREQQAHDESERMTLEQEALKASEQLAPRTSEQEALRTSEQAAAGRHDETLLEEATAGDEADTQAEVLAASVRARNEKAGTIFAPKITCP